MLIFFSLFLWLFFSICLGLCFQYTARVNVRLVDGNNRCAGRVEVLHRGRWGRVYDFGWDMADAAVVCRELDCGEPIDALNDAQFGPGSGSIWMNYIRCIGSESTLKNCGSKGWGKNDRDHSVDAGIICSGKLSQTSIYYYCTTMINHIFMNSYNKCIYLKHLTNEDITTKFSQEPTIFPVHNAKFQV